MAPWIAQAVRAAAELHLADHLAEQSRTASDLASLTGTRSDALYRLLRALSAVGVFAQDEDGKFAMTPLGATLKSDTDDSLRYAAIYSAAQWHWDAWNHIVHTLKTGETGWSVAHGEDYFPFLERNEEAGRIFNNTMVEFARPVHHGVTAAYDFSQIRTLVDVGGGQGALLTSILQANPGLAGILFDAPNVLDQAKPFLAEAGITDRVELASGSFFETVPSADGYILCHIMHDWQDEPARTILTNIRRAITENGRLLLVDSVIPEGGEFSPGKILDLEMMVAVNGRERTEQEFRDLLGKAGFRLARVIPTASQSSIIEAVPA
nr:methyltransferase [Acrocarpospora catenulata]